MAAPPLYVARALGIRSEIDAEEPPVLVTVAAELPREEQTPVGTAPSGRFVGLGDAIDHDPVARDALLGLSPDPRLDRFRKLRPLTLAAPVSWGWLVYSNAKEVSELSADAERVVQSPAFKAAEADPETAVAAKGRHARIDQAVLMRKAYVGIEALVGVAAIVAIAAGMRRLRPVVVAVGAGAAFWWLFKAAAGGACYGASAWREMLLAILGFGGAVAAFVLAPSEGAVSASLRERLGLRPWRVAEGEAGAQRKDTAATIVAVWAGLALPFILDVLRRMRVDDRVRAAFFVLFCLAAFFGLLLFRTERTKVPPRIRALATAALVGFGVTAAADIGARAGLGAVVETQTCIDAEAAKKMKAVQEASGRETTAARKDTQSAPLAWFVAVIAAPVSEELLYRGALQRVARRAIGARLSVLLSALVFGLAHAFAFKFAFYQHIGLGLAFAAVFELAGGGAVAVVACAATHALWNAWLAGMPVF